MPTSDTIKFIREGQIHEVKNADSNETVLNYVRTKLKKTGSKESCASGDCSSCLMVLGELKNNKINYKTINSCISLLPTIHSKQLIIIEDLVDKNGNLHPVQSAMLKNPSSTQCGFCTPGVTMSLFGIFKNYSKVNDETIKSNMEGNICRCTGYKGIIQAAKSLNNKNRIDHFVRGKKNTIKLLKKINNESLVIYSKGKRFFATKYVTELKKILKKNKDAKLISGQTDVGLMVTQEEKEIDNMIYLSSISELNYIKTTKKYIEVGSQTPLTDFEFFIEKYYPDFTRMLKRYGSVGIRNFGTLAGNIQTASPIGDSLPALLALEAKVVLKSIKKTKIVPLDNFFIGYRKTKLKKGQFISAILIPLHKGILKIYKISKRYGDDISSVCAAFNIEIKDKKIKFIKLAFGGMAAVPKIASAVEKVLLNSPVPITEQKINKARQAIDIDFKAISDMRASGKYRMEVAKNLIEKCFLEIKHEKRISVYD